MAGSLVCAGLAIALTATLGPGLPRAQADPEEDKRRVEDQLDGARHDLDESSAGLRAATQAVSAAEGRLRTARDRLAVVRGQLTAARARDAAVAADLERARAAVRSSRSAVSRADGQVRVQRQEIGAFASATYRNSGLDEIAAILRSETTGELLGRFQLVRSVADSQKSALDGLNAARARSVAERDVLATAEEEVARQRQAAAAHLSRARALADQARAAATSIQRLVAERRSAQMAATRARADDLRRYQQLVAERARIQAMLKVLACREAEEERRRRGGGGGGGGGGDGRLSRPLEARITSPYGMRFHPILHRWKLHDGTDFGASCGTPIRAAAAGRVVARYYNSGYGNRVLVSHGRMGGASIVTAYNHMSSYAVRKGDQVSKGEVVGYVGTTGYSTGCHLHFMVYRNGATTDPMKWL
ncbi:hypothetical protein GCM10023317_14040 [Actinopolymorpha pittospori]